MSYVVLSCLGDLKSIRGLLLFTESEIVILGTKLCSHYFSSLDDLFFVTISRAKTRNESANEHIFKDSLFLFDVPGRPRKKSSVLCVSCCTIQRFDKYTRMSIHKKPIENEICSATSDGVAQAHATSIDFHRHGETTSALVINIISRYGSALLQTRGEQCSMCRTSGETR